MFLHHQCAPLPPLLSHVQVLLLLLLPSSRHFLLPDLAVLVVDVAVYVWFSNTRICCFVIKVKISGTVLIYISIALLMLYIFSFAHLYIVNSQDMKGNTVTAYLERRRSVMSQNRGSTTDLRGSQEIQSSRHSR
jgi:hypothetical protein